MEVKCQNCKYWKRAKIISQMPLKIGDCQMVDGINYDDLTTEANYQISNGRIGGDNVYTNENFGCINFALSEFLTKLGEAGAKGAEAGEKLRSQLLSDINRQLP